MTTLCPGSTVRTSQPLRSLNPTHPVLPAGSTGYVIQVREGMIEVYFEDHEMRFIRPYHAPVLNVSNRDWSNVPYRERSRLARELVYRLLRNRRTNIRRAWRKAARS